MKRTRFSLLLLLLSAILCPTATRAEDGHRLWLRMTAGNNTQVTGPACTATDELRQYW